MILSEKERLALKWLLETVKEVLDECANTCDLNNNSRGVCRIDGDTYVNLRKGAEHFIDTARPEL